MNIKNRIRSILREARTIKINDYVEVVGVGDSDEHINIKFEENKDDFASTIDSKFFWIFGEHNILKEVINYLKVNNNFYNRIDLLNLLKKKFNYTNRGYAYSGFYGKIVVSIDILNTKKTIQEHGTVRNKKINQNFKIRIYDFDVVGDGSKGDFQVTVFFNNEDDFGMAAKNNFFTIGINKRDLQTDVIQYIKKHKDNIHDGKSLLNLIKQRYRHGIISITHGAISGVNIIDIKK